MDASRQVPRQVPYTLQIPVKEDVSPAARALWMTVRQALLMIVAGIELYLGIARKG